MRNHHAALVSVGGFLFALAWVPVQADPMKELGVYKGGLGKFSCDVKDLGSGKMFKRSPS